MVVSCIEVSDVLEKEIKNSIWGMLAFDCVCTKSLQLCLTLCNPMNCSLPGSSVHGIFQARILEWVAISKLWKILEEMGIPYHITCLLRNLYAGQVATVRTRHGTVDWFKIGKVVHQGCILSPCLYHSVLSPSCKSLGWMKHKLDSKLSSPSLPLTNLSQP